MPTPSSSHAPNQAAHPATPVGGTPLPPSDRHRWVPTSARLLVEVDVVKLRDDSQSVEVLALADPLWQRTVEPVLKSLGIKPAGLERVSWAASDLARWADNSVVLLRLADHQDATALDGTGQAVDLELEGHRCYQLADRAWPHPFAVLDKQTILTGRRELLAELARPAPRPVREGLGRLLEHCPADADVRLLVDLRAARDAGWPLPAQRMEVWPKGRDPWRLVWDSPDGIGLSLVATAKPQTVCVLACDTRSAAEKVLAAVEELLPAARDALTALAADTGQLASAGLTPETIGQYGSLLGYAGAALEASHARQIEDVVVVESAWPGSLSLVALAARDGSPGARADWLAAALAGCRARQERIGAGLTEYQKTEQKLPAGGGGGGLLPPETRLSWLATMLPYLDKRDWHDRLQFAYNWNGNENRPVTSQPLEEVINPALGPSRTEAGFPVTHYVGVAGVGPDAATLPANHPRAGVFGYGRTTRLDEIGDGASNTIAVLGVTDQLGPWAAGGGATIRALTRAPYVNGPDGFGSGQPGGMLAGMADGSARYISTDVDPRVLEQLATINGGEGTTVAALEIKPPPAAIAAVEPAASIPAEGTPDKPPEEQPAGPLAGQAAMEPAADPADEAARSDEAPAGARPALEAIDVAARLGTVLPSVSEPAISLRDLARFVTDFGGVPVTFDPAALELRGASLADKVEVRVKEASLQQVLEAGVSRRGLVVLAGEHSVLVTCPPSTRQDSRTVRYDVSDLIGLEPEGLAQFGKMVETLVAPDSWESAGGLGSMTADRTALVVRQTELVHFQVLTFCERLRVARGLPLRSRYPADLFRTATRAERARPVLDRAVTVNFQPGTPLDKILRYIEDQTAVAIAADWERLAEAGIGPAIDAAVAADKLPLHDVLTELLQPLGLTFYPLDERTLVLTTRRAAAAELHLEMYPIGSLLADGTPEGQLVERLQGELGGGTWADAGGTGVVVFDEPADALLVLQSPLVQQAIANWLRTAAEAEK